MRRFFEKRWRVLAFSLDVPPPCRQILPPPSNSDKAIVKLLRAWLPEQTTIPDESMKKLWQGILYCLWHADKALYQSELIDRLSAALNTLPLPLALQYFAVFLFTMRRECFLRGFFEIMDGGAWDLELTRRLIGVLFDGTFLAGDMFNGSGVSYHVACAFVEEIRPFLPLRKEVSEVVFGPFVVVMGVVDDKVLVGKIKSCLFDELLKMGKRLIDVKKKSGSDDDDDDVVLGSFALSMEFGKRFYEMGCSPDCCRGNRAEEEGFEEMFRV
ncbi:hypothetical protein Bca101_016640 [Brassica carinata]